MNIVSFLYSGFARDYQRAALDLACEKISAVPGNSKAVHISHEDMLDTKTKLQESAPSLLVIDFGWSSIYTGDKEFLNYLKTNKTPVMVINSSECPNRLPNDIFNVSVRQNALTREPITDIILSVFSTAANDGNAETLQKEINQVISKRDFNTDAFTEKVIAQASKLRHG